MSGGSSSAPPKPGLVFWGRVSFVISATQFVCDILRGRLDAYFRGWTVYVVRDAGGAAAAPQGEGELCSVYASQTGLFTHAAFTTGLAIGDEVYLLHPSVASTLGIAPSVGLWMFGVVDPTQVASTTVITTNNLQGVPSNVLEGQFWMQVIHNASAPGTAPEGEIRQITDFLQGMVTQTFTTDAFTVNVEAGDLVCIVHESLLSHQILGTGTLDTSSTTVPADSTRVEGDNYFNGCLLMTTEGAIRFQPRRILDYTGVGGICTLDPENPFTALPGTVSYVIIGDQTEFVPGVDGANNRTPADVIGGKADTIPAMNLAPGATDSLVRHLKAILERIGQTPADPDDPLLTVTGQRDDVATLDDMSDILTTSLSAKIRLILNRLSTNAFTAAIQGAARTELDTILYQLATYFSALGAAYSATVDPGGAARTNIEQTLEDLGAMLAGAAGITTFPAGAAPANGVSIAEVLRQIYDDIVALTNAKPNVQEVIIYPVAEDVGVTELADDGTSPPYYPVAAHSTAANAEAAPGVAFSEDIDFEQEGTITIISIYAEFEWQTRFLIGVGGGTQSSSKIQISRDGGANWVDLTDNFNNAAAAFTNRIRAGVGVWVPTIVAGANQLQFRLVHWTDDGGAVATSEAQIRSNSYVRITYRKA